MASSDTSCTSPVQRQNALAQHQIVASTQHEEIAVPGPAGNLLQSVADPTRQRGLLILTIDNAREYFKPNSEDGDALQGEPITLCGLQWNLVAYRDDADGTPWLCVYASSSKDQPEKWNCKAACVVRFRSSLPDAKGYKFCSEFDPDYEDKWGPDDLMTIQDLLEPTNGYLKDGKITVTCSITAFLPTQCEALEGLRGEKRRCTDVKIVLGDRHLYANKGILAVSCEFFDGLFYSDIPTRNKDEILLEDVDFDDFTQFVKVMYPPYGPIDEDNIAAVMPLADRFGAKFILDECQLFLFDEMEVTDAIPIIDKCGLSDLKQQLLESASRSELNELSDEEVLETLSRDTMASILKENKRRSLQP